MLYPDILFPRILFRVVFKYKKYSDGYIAFFHLLGLMAFEFY